MQAARENFKLPCFSGSSRQGTGRGVHDGAVERDEAMPGRRRQPGIGRLIVRPVVPPGPLHRLKSLIYEAYAAAGAPTLDEITAAVADDAQLAGNPSRGTVHRVIADADTPAKQADAVAVAAVLTRMAGGDGRQAARQMALLWTQARLAVPIGRPVRAERLRPGRPPRDHLAVGRSGLAHLRRTSPRHRTASIRERGRRRGQPHGDAGRHPLNR